MHCTFRYVKNPALYKTRQGFVADIYELVLFAAGSGIKAGSFYDLGHFFFPFDGFDEQSAGAFKFLTNGFKKSTSNMVFEF